MASYRTSVFTVNQHLDKLITFCKDGMFDRSQTSENMDVNDWENKPHTLLNVLLKQRRFDSPDGEFHLIFDDDVLVACGGVYKLKDEPQVAVAGVRTWVHFKYRNEQIARDYLLPLHKEWAIENKCKIAALTFNEHTKNLIKIWQRRRLGEQRTPRQPHHLFYENFNEVPFPIMFNRTKQWVIYEKFSDWDFDWSKLQA